MLRRSDLRPSSDPASAVGRWDGGNPPELIAAWLQRQDQSAANELYRLKSPDWPEREADVRAGPA